MPVISGGALLRHPKRPTKGGTLTCVVMSRNDSRTRYLLTAGHVISLNGYARQGDPVEAFLEDEERWVKVGEFETSVMLRDTAGMRQICDAAIARITAPELVSDEVEGIGVPAAVATQLYEDMRLQFRGAASKLVKDARVQSLHRQVPIFYNDASTGGVFSLTFEDQVLYRRPGETGWMPATQGVDSGSLIFDQYGLAVGMHIGRTPDDFEVAASVCTPIQVVLDALSVQFPTAAVSAGNSQTPGGQTLSHTDTISSNAFDEIGVLLQSLMIPHNDFGGVPWQLSRDGLVVSGRLERSPGTLVTVPRVWTAFGEDIRASARKYKVPVELIVATICTETSGREDAVRTEPGWISDEETPHRVSSGLMQTLISTARSATGNAVLTRDDLKVGSVSIDAGTAYIDRQRTKTRLDPPQVACAYNAGDLYANDGSANRWKLRQYPIGTGAHADRFVKWFNDCFAYFALNAGQVPTDAPSYFRLLAGA